MAEHEVIKYTKRAYKVSRDPEKHWKEKIKEIMIDVFIIVFAVSLSFYLHGIAEKSGEHHIEDEFLKGLRVDLQNDIKELSSDSLSYVKVLHGFKYFLTRSDNNTYSTSDDSTRYYWNTLYNTTDLIPNNSRFEGLKSAGKLYVVEDKELLNDILDLYQEMIPSLLTATGHFSDFKTNKLVSLLENNIVAVSDTDNNLGDLLKNNHVLRNYLRKQGAINEIIKRYHLVLQQCRKIIEKIDTAVK